MPDGQRQVVFVFGKDAANLVESSLLPPAKAPAWRRGFLAPLIFVFLGFDNGQMLDWFSETMLKIVTSVPALFVAEDSPTFPAVRAMFGLILIVLVAYLIAMRP